MISKRRQRKSLMRDWRIRPRLWRLLPAMKIGAKGTKTKKVSSVFWGWLYSENRAPRAKIQQKEAPLACTAALTQYRAEEGFAALFHSVFDHAYWKKASAAPARSFFRPPDRRLALVLLN